MAATQTLVARQTNQDQPKAGSCVPALVTTTALTAVAILVQGYHPFAEDGGVYLPGILKLLHPELYPTWTGFVTAQSRFSLFAPLVAGLVRLSHLGVMFFILATYAVTIWVTLFAAWQIALRCFRRREPCYAGVIILAICLSVPIAGTSLMLMDPYVTARSVSTPCSLLALIGAMDFLSEFKRTGRFRKRSLALSAISLLIAAMVHPLMATYAGECIVLLACSSLTSTRFRLIAFAAVAFFSAAIAAILYFLASPEPAGYRSVALTRYYWFLSAWHWYEVLGLIAPLVVLAVITRQSRNLNVYAHWLGEMAISAGLIAILIALLFAHESSRSYLVAMLQPLRIFQMVYIVLFLFLGSALADTVLNRNPFAWLVLIVTLSPLMLFVQLRTFPNSSHLEFPCMTATNDWERGFFWIRKNTPVDATFALDAHYINSAHEDAQSFRAIAERSSLPDYDKDGGIAAIRPDLSSEWTTGKTIQTDIATISDAQRKSRLIPERVYWLVLPSNSSTMFPCPYRNGSMKVCQIPQQ